MKEIEYKPYKVIAEHSEEINFKEISSRLCRRMGIIPYGEIGSKIARDLQALCYSSVNKLKKYFMEFLKNNGYSLDLGEDYLFAYYKGAKEENVMLTAHLDTVQNQKGAKVIYVSHINNKHYLWSPNGIGGDDRCGILVIKRLIEKGYKPTVLFCDKEEIGGVGSREFNEKYKDKLNINCIIELDRKGNDNLVFYEENNKEWKNYLTNLTGWKEEVGSFSDICNLYDLGCASVNLSVGYYNQHTKDEYIVLEDLENSIFITEKTMNSIDRKWEHVSM